MTNEIVYPKSPREEIDGIPYFVRMCDKMRMFAAGELESDYHGNLGKGFDLWTCEFMNVKYEDLVAKVNAGASDAEALAWVVETGGALVSPQKDWWLSYMRNRGHADDLAEILELRKVETGFGGRDDIENFFDFIDADEGRDLV